MKPATLFLAGIVLAAGVTASSANQCADRFAGVLVGSGDRYPAQGLIVTQTKGQPAVANAFYYKSWDHYLLKPVDPANTPWMLTYDGKTYQSTDKGATWKVAYSFDKNQTRQQGIASVKAQAKSIRNAVCTSEQLDGTAHEVMAADMTFPPPKAFDISSRYWVRRDGFVTKATILMKTPAFESLTTQTWVKPEAIDLPVPK